MAVHLVIAEKSGKTGKILADLLKQNGVNVTSSYGGPTVSYGVRIGTTQSPTLNAFAGMADKKDQLVVLAKGGVLVPRIFTGMENIPASEFPLLARKRQHKAGKDIMAVFQPEEIPWRRAAGASFFVKHVPIDTEYRVWIYRSSHLGTYEKSMVRPAEFRAIGRNYKNGFAFNLVKSDGVPRGAVEAAMMAVKVCNLDFGAVDILKGKDGRFYVLEINTAPGVEGPGRQVIQSLAAKIANWEKKGYPKRGSD